MPVTVTEKYNSRSKNTAGSFEYTSTSTGPVGATVIRTKSITVEYIVMGAEDVTEAIAETFAQVPATEDDIGISTITCNEEAVEGAVTTGIGGVHVTVVTYSSSKRAGGNNGGEEAGDGADTFTFDTSGGTTHITQSLDTIDYGSLTFTPLPAAVGTAGAINADGETVHGVDIVTPSFNFTETRWVSTLTVDQTYKLLVSELTGKVNSEPFRGFAAGEVLFLGANGNRSQGSVNWQIVYSFSVKRNKTNIVIDATTIDEKDGWDYLWLRYEHTLPPLAVSIYLKPASYYIERIYERGDLNDLGIPVPEATPYGQ